MVNFSIFVHKNVYRIRFQKIKNKRVLRKLLSSGQKWFLKPYFPLIRGMFVFRSGLRFSFRALEVPQPRVRKRPFSLTKKIHRDKFNESQSMFLPLLCPVSLDYFACNAKANTKILFTILNTNNSM